MVKIRKACDIRIWFFSFIQIITSKCWTRSSLAISAVNFRFPFPKVRSFYIFGLKSIRLILFFSKKDSKRACFEIYNPKISLKNTKILTLKKYPKVSPVIYGRPVSYSGNRKADPNSLFFNLINKWNEPLKIKL